MEAQFPSRFLAYIKIPASGSSTSGLDPESYALYRDNSWAPLYGSWAFDILKLTIIVQKHVAYWEFEDQCRIEPSETIRYRMSA